MPFPPTCQSPVTCHNRPSRKIGNTWLCLACFEYTEHHKHLPIPEETMSEPIHDQILAYVQQHGPTHMKQLSKALNIGMSSISSAAVTLRRSGHITPASGDGVIRLAPAPDDSALPDAVPGYPLLWQSPDRQGGAVCVRGTRVDVVTLWANAPAESAAHAYNITTEQAQAAIDYVNAHPELQPPVPEDTVQTSEADTLRAEVARLTTAYSNLEEENARIESHLRSELETALDEIGALKHGPAVRLEWSPWQEAESGVDTHLWLRIGQIEASIVHIESDLGIKATLFYSDEIGGTTAQIRGMKPEDVAAPLSVLLTAAGLTMPPIPTLPESA